MISVPTRATGAANELSLPPIERPHIQPEWPLDSRAFEPSSHSTSAPRLAGPCGLRTAGSKVAPHRFVPSRYDGGGMRYLRFRGWLNGMATDAAGLAAIYFEEVRRHVGTDAAHLYGGFLATLTSWCEQQGIAYQGVPVGTIKRFIAGKGNADKAAVIRAVRARGFAPADDNEADAIAILLWSIETNGGVQ